MASRVRQRKPRITRMDAAIDAMVPFGFSEGVVRRTVKELLKVYGGDEGWAFLEGDAYKLLIETILDEQDKREQEQCKQEKCAGEENLLKNTFLPLKIFGKWAVRDRTNYGICLGQPLYIYTYVMASIRKENTIEQIMSNLPLYIQKGSLLQTREQRLDDSSEVGRAGDMSAAAGPSGAVAPTVSEAVNTTLQSIESEGNCHPLPAEVDDERQKDIGMLLGNAPFHSPPPVTPSLVPVDSLPTRRRKPCHGWISSDDEEDDFIDLPPLPPAKMGKRKTRWDLRPEDI